MAAPVCVWARVRRAACGAPWRRPLVRDRPGGAPGPWQDRRECRRRLPGPPDVAHPYGYGRVLDCEKIPACDVRVFNLCVSYALKRCTMMVLMCSGLVLRVVCVSALIFEIHHLTPY